MIQSLLEGEQMDYICDSLGKYFIKWATLANIFCVFSRLAVLQFRKPRLLQIFNLTKIAPPSGAFAPFWGVIQI